MKCLYLLKKKKLLQYLYYIDLDRIILYHSDISFQRERNKNSLKCINIKCIKHYVSVFQTGVCEGTADGL